jgi:uncharacterized membrane protein
MIMAIPVQPVDPTIMEMITRALLDVVEAFLHVVTVALNYIEQGLRDALATAHVEGDLQTLIVAIVPLLFLAIAFKLMGGFLRLVAIIVLIILLAHILLPVAERLIHGG